MTGIKPVTSCLGNRRSLHLSYILIGSIDGSCTRFSMLEGHGNLSTRPRCYKAFLVIILWEAQSNHSLKAKAGMDGFEPTVFRSTGDCFEPD